MLHIVVLIIAPASSYEIIQLRDTNNILHHCKHTIIQEHNSKTTLSF